MKDTSPIKKTTQRPPHLVKSQQRTFSVFFFLLGLKHLSGSNLVKGRIVDRRARSLGPVFIASFFSTRPIVYACKTGAYSGALAGCSLVLLLGPASGGGTPQVKKHDPTTSLGRPRRFQIPFIINKYT